MKNLSVLEKITWKTEIKLALFQIKTIASNILWMVVDQALDTLFFFVIEEAKGIISDFSHGIFRVL